MNQIVTQQAAREAVSFSKVGMASTHGGAGLSPETLGDVVAFAQLMSRSQHAIPKHLRENPGACLAVTMQAMRWQMDPFAVASKTYNVKDQVAYEAQVVAAAVNTLAPLKSRPRIEFSGAGDNRVCTVTADFKDGSTHEYVSPKIKDIPTKNSPLWKGDPDQQLGYYSVRSFARRHCPEVILGVYTPDELEHAPPMRHGGEASGMRARLEARQVEGGFDADHVATTLDGAQGGGQEGEEPTDAEFTQDPYDDDGFPGDKAAAFDHIAWATAENAKIDACASIAALDEIASHPDAEANFGRLREAAPAMAKALDAALNGKRKALMDRERSQ